MLRSLVFLTSVMAATSAAPAQPMNPQIDYRGFEELTQSIGPYRQSRLLSWSKFGEAASRRSTLILDARSADAYQAGHIKGAVNLPLTDFTAQSLARTIGNAKRPILIYCNNNFSNNVQPVPMKLVQLALNIQTFINLVGYGYRNVWELNEVVDFNDPKVGWVKQAPTSAKVGQ